MEHTEFKGVIYFIVLSILYIIYIYTICYEFKKRLETYNIYIDITFYSFLRRNKLNISVALVMIAIISYLFNNMCY